MRDKRKGDVELKIKEMSEARARHHISLTGQLCEICGNLAKHRHHEDYNKPLKVRLLCEICHRKIHKEEEMKTTKEIPFYIESINGHDTEFLKQGKVLQDEVEEHLVKDEWVSLEKQNGTTELLTKSDIPTGQATGQAQPSKQEWEGIMKCDKNAVKPTETKKKEWAEKFEKVESATATTKAKGG